MKHNLRMIASLICLICSSSSLLAVSAKKSQEIEDGNYDRNNVWVGPGWYGEAWIDTEADFDDWFDDDHHDRDDDWDRDHRRDDHRDDRRDDRDRDGHH